MTQCSHKPRKNEAVEEVSKGERLMSERTLPAACIKVIAVVNHGSRPGCETWMCQASWLWFMTQIIIYIHLYIYICNNNNSNNNSNNNNNI